MPLFTISSHWSILWFAWVNVCSLNNVPELNHKIRLLSTTNPVNLHSVSVIWLFLWAWALLLLTWLISLGWVGRKLAVLCGQEKVLQLFCIDGHLFRRQPAFELLQSTAKKTIMKDYMHTGFQIISWKNQKDHSFILEDPTWKLFVKMVKVIVHAKLKILSPFKLFCHKLFLNCIKRKRRYFEEYGKLLGHHWLPQ